MKLTLVALTLLLSVTLARADTKGADTKSVLDVRAMTLNRSSANNVTTGIGPVPALGELRTRQLRTRAARRIT